MLEPLNLFYEEPDPDRWLPGDRYPRAIIRRMVRGRPSPGGHERVFLNLCEGLRRLRVPFRTNDYGFARNNPRMLACIVGKPIVLDRTNWKNPILFGAAGYSHPSDDLDLFRRLPVKKVLVPGPWMKEMFDHDWGNAVEAWPVGIDTNKWTSSLAMEKSFDVLIYDKVRWDRDQYQAVLAEPIRRALNRSGITFRQIRYGFYREAEFQAALAQCRAMIFLCEHETQGIAYQQALSCGVPIFAWDRGGRWRDPSYYPHRVQFGPVTSVPYWDERCGMKFEDFPAFEERWDEFWANVMSGRFAPRDYVLENLTLEQCAGDYLRIAESIC
jgi:hypothetical protein